METVNKSELVHRVARGSNVDHQTALNVVNALIEEVQGAVASGDKVVLVGFGTFEGRARAARTARDPRTGEEISVEAKTAPAFKAAVTFKKRVADAAKSAAQ